LVLAQKGYKLVVSSLLVAAQVRDPLGTALDMDPPKERDPDRRMTVAQYQVRTLPKEGDLGWGLARGVVVAKDQAVQMSIHHPTKEADPG
jgi:hypothetical protein